MTKPVTAFLHLGAHRTGTSSFQLALDENADVLRAAGYDLAYPGRDGAPHGTLKLKLPRPASGPGEIRRMTGRAEAEIARHLTGRDRLVLSEENVPGRMFHFYKGGFFPARRTRFDTLRSVLPGPVAHVLYVLRPYDGLFKSAYRLRTADNPMRPFPQLRDGLTKITDGWPDLLADLQDCLKPNQMTVVDYRVRGDSVSLMSRLLPDVDESMLQEPEARVNASLSDVQLLAAQRRMNPDSADWASFDDDAPIAAFTDDHTRQLADRYESDLDRITAMPGITLIRK